MFQLIVNNKEKTFKFINISVSAQDVLPEE